MAKINRRSEVWLIIEVWATEKLAKERKSNDTPGTDVCLTEGHRGAIRILEELLAFPDGAKSTLSKGTGDNYGLGTRQAE